VVQCRVCGSYKLVASYISGRYSKHKSFASLPLDTPCTSGAVRSFKRVHVFSKYTSRRKAKRWKILLNTTVEWKRTAAIIIVQPRKLLTARSRKSGGHVRRQSTHEIFRGRASDDILKESLDDRLTGKARDWARETELFISQAKLRPLMYTCNGASTAVDAAGEETSIASGDCFAASLRAAQDK